MFAAQLRLATRLSTREFTSVLQMSQFIDVWWLLHDPHGGHHRLHQHGCALLRHLPPDLLLSWNAEERQSVQTGLHHLFHSYLRTYSQLARSILRRSANIIIQQCLSYYQLLAAVRRLIIYSVVSCSSVSLCACPSVCNQLCKQNNNLRN